MMSPRHHALQHRFKPSLTEPHRHPQSPSRIKSFFQSLNIKNIFCLPHPRLINIPRAILVERRMPKLSEKEKSH